MKLAISNFFRHPRTVRSIGWLLVLAFVIIAFDAGVHFRRWSFETTKPIRYHDIDRGLAWGLLASGPEGYLNQYEKMAPETPKWTNFLDYGVLRLAVMTEWAKWARRNYPETNDGDPFTRWQPQFEFSAPVMFTNTAMETLGAVCAFLLTRLWIRRSIETPKHFTGVWQGLAAACLYWFNPAIMISAYGWPIWDGWIIPWYLLAALLASGEWWFMAGIALGVGAMFKGQQLAVAPIFILWPLVQGRVGAAMRWCSGLLFAVAVIVSPFLFSYLDPGRVAAARAVQEKLEPAQYPADLFVIPRYVDVPAILWVAGMLLAAGVVPRLMPHARKRFAGSSITLFRHDQFRRTVAVLILSLAASWPCFIPRNHGLLLIGLTAALALNLAAFVTRQTLRFTLPAVGAVGAFACMIVFHGSHAWWDCGIHFGTIHWEWLKMSCTDNLPGLLEVRYGWPQDAHTPLFAIAGHVVDCKLFFNTIATSLMIVCGLFIGMHAKRRNRAMLIALTTPWLIFFSFPVQIHERYLLFAAGVSSIALGCGVGFGLLTLFLSAVTFCMTIQNMTYDANAMRAFGLGLHNQFPRIFSENAGPILHKYIVGTHPDIAWAVLLTTGIYLYLTVTPWRERARKDRSYSRELASASIEPHEQARG